MSIIPSMPLLPVLLRDDRQWINRIRGMDSVLPILLLTPVLPGEHSNCPATSDAFEPLGRRLSSYHTSIRHVPYRPDNGIESYHIPYLHVAAAVIFVINEVTPLGQSLQIEISKTVFAAALSIPVVILLTCPIDHILEVNEPYPTAICSHSRTPASLQAAAVFLFTCDVSDIQPAYFPRIKPMSWHVENMSKVDLPEVHRLWCGLDDRFHLSQEVLHGLLMRPGWGKHYIVRSRHGALLGFCASYLTYMGTEGVDLLGSVAMLITEPSMQRRGIGLSLFNHAIQALRAHTGVKTIQLGSNFPRLLSGLPVTTTTRCFDTPRTLFRRTIDGRMYEPRGFEPTNAKYIAPSGRFFAVEPLRDEDIACETSDMIQSNTEKHQDSTNTWPGLFYLKGRPDYGWFRRRGWKTTRYVSDVVIDIENWRTRVVETDGIEWRACTDSSSDRKWLLEIVEEEMARADHSCFGWYEQYERILNGPEYGNIILITQGPLILCAGITYSAGTGTAFDMPLAQALGDDVGGLTCTVISDTALKQFKGRRDTLRILLLDACIRAFTTQGLKRLWLDEIVDLEAYTGLGFCEFARYREASWEVR